jgi:hypothetical protein
MNLPNHLVDAGAGPTSVDTDFRDGQLLKIISQVAQAGRQATHGALDIDFQATRKGKIVKRAQKCRLLFPIGSIDMNVSAIVPRLPLQ